MSKQIGYLDNMFRMNAKGLNPWSIPDTDPFNGDMDGVKWFSFNEKNKITDPENSAIHFYLHDRQFGVVWNRPDKYLDLFRSVRAVVAPDFSNYTDMPKVQQMWNHYRRQWCARYWQINGVNVISSLSGAGDIFEPWAYAGIPKGTICACSHAFDYEGEEMESGLKIFKEAIGHIQPSKLFIKVGKRGEDELRKHFDFEVIPLFKRGGD